jgi:hypothetical protein
MWLRIVGCLLSFVSKDHSVLICRDQTLQDEKKCFTFEEEGTTYLLIVGTFLLRDAA